MHRRAVAVAAVAFALPVSSVGIAAAQGAGETIRMREFRFIMPANLDAGKTTITFRNTGEFDHNFTVVAALGGGKTFKSATIKSGQQQQKTVNLRPGAYIAICTVFNGGHLAAGMHSSFSVGKLDQETGEWGP